MRKLILTISVMSVIGVVNIARADVYCRANHYNGYTCMRLQMTPAQANDRSFCSPGVFECVIGKL